MSEIKKVKIGVLGMGVVGEELISIILNNRDKIRRQYSLDLEIKGVFVRNLDKPRRITGLNLTDNAEELLDDPEISVICECIGGAGTEKTREYVFRAVNNGKSVIMSSKKVLALYGKELMQKVLENKVGFGFDATVGGGIPIAKILKNCFKGEGINRVIGILNATSNFIYTRMDKDGLSFEEALKKAQELGYAENDPSEDINGYDALYKAIVLTLFSMKTWTDIRKYAVVPFSQINAADMKYAKELGYHIKPLVVVEKKKSIVYRIGPCLVKESNIAATTNDNFNVIVLEGTNTGVLGFYGQGAGSKPTASAMFDDLINVLNKKDSDELLSHELQLDEIHDVNSLEEYKNNLYWRITVENRVGMFANIASTMAKNNINIERIIQKDEEGDRIGVVLLTSSIDTETISNIIDELKENNIIINAVIPFLDE